ncbi:transcriptional modulator of MazE/toxin MazF [Thermincola ferriacetica]|uniref:Transcriptional modulator of MazE/toxin MazF n=1 Tax=Thermincola ferriacetica TaxID=281456 RepID=A0A0L6W2Y7_9FIRM|nr:type II toxin-antitoxin system PemK/MazF family toxin [Thermincola ferriacetica]KNZ69846.1 transcriptional modulator of MazE/toxin MazF [Thermincola ferriacetica]
MSGNNEDKAINNLSESFKDIIKDFKPHYFLKTLAIIKHLPDICKLHYQSLENRKARSEHQLSYHPVRPLRGEIFNAIINENIGSELCGNHLVIIISNDTGNIYSEKVNVLPIEGDGTKINPKYQMRLSNSDLESGHLDKDPSRIIFTDIMTIDKARLDIKIGKIKHEKMKEINSKLRKQLHI